ncbi:MAG TPA: helix-turn-helix transcriptional regulator [Vicinamibacterales bacterium]|nr:helix-turn-helix transcriptional regulator [Vicinamibacterales bacterium]
MPRRPAYATLAVLNAIANGSRHGFDIIDMTGLPGGTVYPALGKLEADGRVRSTWEDPRVAQQEKRPPRRYYELRPAGETLLREGLKAYRALERRPAASRRPKRA